MSGYVIGTHRDSHLGNVLQYAISYEELNSIPTNNKIAKVVKYIYYNKSWERCCVILNNIFRCIIVLCLVYSHVGMKKFIIIQE